MDVTREQIRGFRLRGHHLDRRLPAGSLESVFFPQSERRQPLALTGTLLS